MIKWVLKKILKIALRVLIALLALVIVAIGVLNLLKFAIYKDYYQVRDNLCKNPGLGDGFVCQGICAYEDGGKIFVSGYMKDGSASRIYVTDLDDNSYYVSLAKEGENFTGHAGGIAWSGDTVYIASDGAIHLVSLQSVLNAAEGDTVEIYDEVAVSNKASSLYCDGTYLYVGEFHDGGKYIANHPYETADGTYHAIISCYALSDLSAPERIYSIRDKVQGICFTPNGKVVLSTSYGLSSSYYYIYNLSEATLSGVAFDGAPVYYLDHCVSEIKGPAMAEGLDYYDGKIITLTESASNKYIFGKLFFANKIVALDIVD